MILIGLNASDPLSPPANLDRESRHNRDVRQFATLRPAPYHAKQFTTISIRVRVPAKCRCRLHRESGKCIREKANLKQASDIARECTSADDARYRMTSRVLIDVRDGEGVVLAALLRDLGFIVDVVILVPDRTREPHTASKSVDVEQCRYERARLSAPSQFFLGKHQSLAAIDAPLLSGAMDRLSEFLRRSTRATRRSDSCTSLQCSVKGLNKR